MKHFGITVVKRKYSLHLTREEFAPINTRCTLPKFPNLVEENAYVDDSGKQYRLDWCEKYRAVCLKNFDLNMAYFNSLDKNDFNYAVQSFLEKHPQFHQISDLSDYEISGYYLMILDNYKQAYIGKSSNIKKRIQEHWQNTKPFDRTLFPMYDFKKSCFSIDFFRALDTTRIYIWPRKISEGIESALVNDFPNKYLTNRIGGDVTNLLEACTTRNTRIL